MIQPPSENVSRALWRAALEAAAGFTPVTGALSRVYQVTHPTKFSQDLAGWRQEVSSATNDHETRLTALESRRPKFLLSEDAASLALWLVRQSETGLENHVEYEAIVAAFPDASPRELQDAAAELEMHGLASVSKAFGYPLHLLTPSYELFALFDPIAFGTSPQNDAVRVARAALDLDSGTAEELEFHLGWPRRRFNPAFALLLTQVRDGSIRKVIQEHYPRIGFSIGAEERARFKALIAQANLE